MGKLFGTDGIRGIVGEDLTHELALKVGEAAAYVLGGKKDIVVLYLENFEDRGEKGKVINFMVNFLYKEMRYQFFKEKTIFSPGTQG